jgi:hypothetical protein
MKRFHRYQYHQATTLSSVVDLGKPMHYLGNSENGGISTTHKGRSDKGMRGGFSTLCLDKYRQSILDNLLIDPKLFSSSIRWWLEVCKEYLLSINTNKEGLNLHLPYLVLVSSSKFCDAVGFNRGAGFDHLKDSFAISIYRSRGRYF